jgi:thioredoxin reductase (NADPH)
LIRRIEESPNIELHTRTQIQSLEGERHLERVIWQEPDGRLSTHPIRHVFLMTGAVPNTDWLRDCLACDRAGFILTGNELSPEMQVAFKVATGRVPSLFETSLPGVFAIGDVRASSMKRVASAVGEGSICVKLVQKTLAM